VYGAAGPAALPLIEQGLLDEAARAWPRHESLPLPKSLEVEEGKEDEQGVRCEKAPRHPTCS
jgi:hypothetical protein